MVRLGSFSNLGCLDAPAVLPTTAVADPGAGPGGPALPPPPHYLKVWIGTVLCGSMETPKAKTEPMVPPASSDFWKAP